MHGPAGQTPPSSYRAGLHRLALLTAAATFLVLLAGASVTSTGSGLSVPDWPLSYGKLFPRMTGGIFFEHGHRMVAGTVLLLVGALAVWSWRARVDRTRRVLATSALALVLIQAVLGGLTVLLLLPPRISIAHAVLAMLVFSAVVTLALLTSRGWLLAGGRAAGEWAGGRVVAWAGVVATSLVFLQILAGAVMRHTGAGLACPDFPKCHGEWIPPLSVFPLAIHFAHRAGGVLTALAVWGLALLTWRRAGTPSRLRSLSLTSSILVLAQFALGVAAVLSRLAPLVTVLHHAGGALLLAVVLSQTLWAFRRGAPSPAHPALATAGAGAVASAAG